MYPQPFLLQQSFIPCSTTSASQQLFVSTSNRFLAVVGSNTAITICSLPNASEIYGLSSENVSEVIFSVDDSYLIVNCVFSVRNYSLASKEWKEDIVHYSPSNAINSIIRSNDYSQLLILNHSQLIVFDSYTHTKIIRDLPSGCQGTILQVQSTGVLITSDYDCTVCSFLFSREELTFKKKNSITGCRLGQLSLIGNQLLISPGTVMDSFAQFLTVDIQTLQVLTRVRFNTSLFPLRVTKVNNYPLVYPFEGGAIEIFNGSLDNSLASVYLENLAILDSSYSPLTNQVLFLLENVSSQASFVATYALTYRCPSKNTTNDAPCLCEAGSQFKLSTGQCIKRKCNQTQCPCPKFYSYDWFTLECSLNCSEIFGSAHLPAFGNPQKCYCKPPLAWNTKLNDCSEIDCSYIPNSISQGASSACTCQQNFIWNSSGYECTRSIAQQPQMEASSSISVGMIIGGIFGLALIVILAILFLYKRRRQMTENERQPYVPYNLHKVLEQLPTHRNLEEDGQGTKVQPTDANIVDSPAKE